MTDFLLGLVVLLLLGVLAMLAALWKRRDASSSRRTRWKCGISTSETCALRAATFGRGNLAARKAGGSNCRRLEPPPSGGGQAAGFGL